MDSPCIKQTVCKVLKIFQCGKYLEAYVLKTEQEKEAGAHCSSEHELHFRVNDVTNSNSKEGHQIQDGYHST